MYRKSTSCNALLHASSCHPKFQLSAITYGEMVRARRNCTECSEFKSTVLDMKQRFTLRGYKKHTLDKAVQRLSQEDTLKPA